MENVVSGLPCRQYLMYHRLFNMRLHVSKTATKVRHFFGTSLLSFNFQKTTKMTVFTNVLTIASKK